ncbi:MAG: hypothetical protein WBW33_27950 [Bryobacteraceae bacterium]
MRTIFAFALVTLCLTLGLQTAVAADPDVTGKWHFVLDTPGGDREVDADFVVDGGKVTGKWGTSDITGTWADGKLALAFSMTSEEAGETSTMKITGKLDNDALTGDWEFSSYSGTYKATRPK